MGFWKHPNCPDEIEGNRRRNNYYWDHGGGIYFWHKEMHGDVVILKDKALHEGHFTKIGKSDYKRSIIVGNSDAQRSMNNEINENFNIVSACRNMGLSDLLLNV
jgi:hypothetical protein